MERMKQRKYLKEIMAETSRNLLKDINVQVQEAQHPRQETENHTQTHHGQTAKN